MDDRRQQFFLMCEDICHTASLADIAVALRTREGHRCHGVPRVSGSSDPNPSRRSRERVIAVGDDRVAIDSIEEISLKAP
jgi:hypothetical protein